MSVLLVDGDNLLTIGFFGVKNYFYKGEHIGGIYHFLNVLRRSFENYRLDKIVVFWDGEDGAERQVKRFPNALFKGFKTLREAEEWLEKCELQVSNNKGGN